MAEELTRIVQERFLNSIIGTHDYRGQETMVIKREGLLELMQFLRDDPAMAVDFLMDLTCVDYLKFGRSLQSAPTLATSSPLPYFMKPKPVAERWERSVSNEPFRFELVYHLYSTRHHHRLRVKVPLTLSDLAVDSLAGLWASANWFEREVWDLFGITFRGHPNLKRILMYEGFQGHPLRKDYPIRKRQPLVGPVN